MTFFSVLVDVFYSENIRVTCVTKMKIMSA